MYGNEKKRVAGNIKMKLRMPTTEFAYLRICVFGSANNTNTYFVIRNGRFFWKK